MSYAKNSPAGRPLLPTLIARLVIVAKIVAVVAAFGNMASAHAEAPRDIAPGRIVSAHGETSIARTGEIVVPADRKPQLRQGDRLRTGSDGRMELLFNDGMRMNLGPTTQLTITEFVTAAHQERSWFDLARGTLRTITGMMGKRDRSSFRLQTPTAVVGIRGTDFTVVQADCPAGHCRDGGAVMEIAVSHGAVDVSGPGGSVSVNAGQRAVIGQPGQSPVLVSRAPPVFKTPSAPLLPPLVRDAARNAHRPPPALPLDSEATLATPGPPAGSSAPMATQQWRSVAGQPPVWRPRSATTMTAQDPGDFGAWE